MAAATVTACGPQVPRPGPGPGTAPPSAAADGTARDARDVRDVRAHGTPVVAGGVTLAAAPGGDATADVTPLPDGAARLALSSPEDDAPQADVLALAAPEGATLTVLADDSVVVRDGDGGFLVGLTPPEVTGVGTSGTARAAPVLSLATPADDLVVWTLTEPDGLAGARITADVASTAVRSADWADRGDEGGRSLVVVPTAFGRSGTLAADEGLWAQVAAVGPDAATDGMHDQLTCHVLGAPDKASWNLEPWRPEVDALAMLAARCNP